MAEQSGMQSTISLPSGGGAIKGMGEKFAPDLHTGTGNFTVPISIPPGRNGFQPQLALGFSTGNGNGLFGLGASLGVAGVTRKTSKGIPRYRDQAPPPQRDTFILSGAEDLVFVGGVTDEAGATADQYRPRTEGLFAEILHYTNAAPETNYWRVRTKDGLTSYYGTHPTQSERPQYPAGTGGAGDPAVLFRPGRTSDVFEWRLTLTKDAFGNRVEYLYDSDEGAADGHAWKQPLLKQVRYGDFGDRANPDFLITLTFQYEDRPDSFSDYRAAFEVRTTKRCRAILVETHADRTRPTRRYEFAYRQDSLTLLSLLQEIRIVGFDDAGVEARELPPLSFGYTDFDPLNRKRRDFYPLKGFDLPATSLANPSLELVDLFGSGLPDILEMSGTVRYWRNRGGGRFAPSNEMDDAPAESFADAGVQLIDANGDGRTDLLVTRGTFTGYYPLQFGGLWDRRSFQKHTYAPSFDLEAPEVRLVDLTGDGITDVIRSGTRLECFFNDAREGWRPDNAVWVEREPLDVFPNVNFSDPRVKWADFSGDGMQDIALVYDRNVEYWPNLGYGKWGKRLHMKHGPHLPYGYDPKRILVGDVNGDGLADIIYIEDRKILLWINQSGNGWSEPIEIHGTPPVSDMDSVRLIDLLGSGISGILWTKDARTANEDHYFFLDLTGGTKPYLLAEMNNNMGAVTKVTYAPSTRFYLEDDKSAATRWRTTLPFPVQVVAQVDVIDALSGGKLSTEYRYHHGYWDGVEREFRGFGCVEQLDSESFEKYAMPGAHGADTAFAAVDRENFAAPTLTRTWFHQGPIGDDATNWQEMDWRHEFWTGDPQQLGHIESTNQMLAQLGQQYSALTSREKREIKRDALRVLRGNVIRTELYALDGTAREDRPYTVTEHLYGVREEAATTAPRKHIFFPHPLSQRTTQWERGEDPMTRLAYTRDYDAFGNALTKIDVACPRGWRHLDDEIRDARYLATLTRSELASPATAAIYIHDRAARAVSYEIANAPIPAAAPIAGRTVAQVLDLALDPNALRIVSESINFYDGDEFVGLPFGVIGLYGAVTRSEALVLTDEIVQNAYGAQTPPYLQPGQPFAANANYPAAFVQQLTPLAGYVYHASGGSYSGGYYVTNNRKRFDFHVAGVARGLVLASLDPLGAQIAVEYGQPYTLLPVAITDAVNLTSSTSYNYRVLKPEATVDPNGNRSRVRFSPIGLVTAIWVQGKAGQNEGDVARASVELEYDFLAYQRSIQQDPARPQPVFVRSVRTIRHDSDPADQGETIESREYSDGFGRVLQSRMQGERVRFGDAIFGGGDAVLPAEQSAGRGGTVQGIANNDTQNPNVIVSGWQRFDNKGNVVEKFEPFFAIGWSYAPPRDSADPAQRDFGVKVAMFYDPRGQVIRTLNPDGSEQRVVYGIPSSLDDPTDPDQIIPTPWEAYTYDANDNAGRTHAGTSSDYRHHWNTPSNVVIDAMGRTIESTVRNRAKPASALAALQPVEEYRTHSAYDIQGNLLRLTDRLNRVAFNCAYDLSKHTLRTEGIDAGTRLVIFDAIGREIERLDGKGARLLHSYDRLGRSDRRWARNDANQAMSLREHAFYGDAGDPNQTVAARDQSRDVNSLGRISRQLDEAGEVIIAAYDFRGNILDKVRRVIDNAPLLAALDAPGGSARGFTINWDNSPPLAGSYATSLTYDALSRVTSVRFPQDVSGVRKMAVPRYNAAGSLESVAVSGEMFVERVAYNAKGQRTLLSYGNGLMTRHAYDPRTANLIRMRTERYALNAPLAYRPRDGLLQDFAYQYDLAGNIVEIIEQTPGCGVRNNPLAPGYPQLQAPLGAGDALVRSFEYDPLYRLTFATGREANNIPANGRPWEDAAREGFNWGAPGAPTPRTARDRTRLYEEAYSYDAADNMLAMRHGTWTRYFGVSGFTPQAWAQEWQAHLDPTNTWAAATSNRLTHVGDAAPGVAPTHFFDANGNLIRQNTERHFAWDAVDRMMAFAIRPVGGAATVEACYLYDSSGQRIKKLVRNGANVQVTVYIDDVFEHRTFGGQQNYTLHVMDDRSRVALLRVGPALQGDSGPAVQYHLGDHLGSSHIVVGGANVTARAFRNREEFFPYGETSFGSFGGKRYRFTGKERDEESGLGYHGARYYAAHCSRWISADPAGAVDTPNLYIYCRNTPLGARDSSGMASSDVADKGTPGTGANNLGKKTEDFGNAALEARDIEFRKNIVFDANGVEVPAKPGERAPRPKGSLEIDALKTQGPDVDWKGIGKTEITPEYLQKKSVEIADQQFAHARMRGKTQTAVAVTYNLSPEDTNKLRGELQTRVSDRVEALKEALRTSDPVEFERVKNLKVGVGVTNLKSLTRLKAGATTTASIAAPIIAEMVWSAGREVTMDFVVSVMNKRAGTVTQQDIEQMDQVGYQLVGADDKTHRMIWEKSADRAVVDFVWNVIHIPDMVMQSMHHDSFVQ